MRVLICLISVLTACAGEERPTVRAGRVGQVDAAPLRPDAGAPDASPLPYDAGPDASPPPAPSTRPIWVIERHDAFADGVRAQLTPPHARGRSATDFVDGYFVVWAGPASPGEAALAAHREAGRPAAALYRLADRAAGPEGLDTVAADARWLAANHLGAHTVQSAGRPALAVTGVVDAPDAWEALRARLSDVADPPAIFAEVDPNTTPRAPDGIDALFPAVAHGYSTFGAARGAAADTARLARWRGAARAVGLGWLPVARPPINPRLDRPSAPPEPPGPAALVRSVVLARRAAEPGGPVLLDGLGAWRDDRQLEPVTGRDSAQPAELTGGHVYRAADRLARVRGLLDAAAGPPPEDLGTQDPVLLYLAEGVETEVRSEPRGLSIEWVDEAGGAGRRAEVVVDTRPFVVPPNGRLRYTRSSDALATDLVFADGTRLLGVLDRPPPGPRVDVPVGAFAGRRVEDVAVVLFSSPAPRGQAALTELQLAR